MDFNKVCTYVSAFQVHARCCANAGAMPEVWNCVAYWKIKRILLVNSSSNGAKRFIKLLKHLPICRNKSLQSLGIIPASVVESCLPIMV